ncbi:MAG: acyl--CoA ligase, partial [Candidatus Krumholzibacteriota bacterium]|nr:acyl--CoA ligase [Candidatus Krumholzibacteriota bacterium]
GYGLVETASIATFNARGRMRMDSVGLPAPGVEVRIDQPDAEGCGEVLLRGPNVFAGYRDDPEANRMAFTGDGWFRTGDLGVVDAEGYLYIAGRIKELIIRGGINISPFEIDEVLMSMDGVRVGLAVGFDNRYYGEEVGAYVQLQLPARFVQTRNGRELNGEYFSVFADGHGSQPRNARPNLFPGRSIVLVRAAGSADCKSGQPITVDPCNLFRCRIDEPSRRGRGSLYCSDGFQGIVTAGGRKRQKCACEKTEWAGSERALASSCRWHNETSKGFVGCAVRYRGCEK